MILEYHSLLVVTFVFCLFVSLSALLREMMVMIVMCTRTNLLDERPTPWVRKKVETRTKPGTVHFVPPFEERS